MFAVVGECLICVGTAILKFNLYSWGVILSVSLLLNLLVPLLAPMFTPDKEPTPPGRLAMASSGIYQRWMKPNYDNWFSLHDICGRFFVDIVAFYIALFSQPFRFIHFNLLALPLWCEGVVGKIEIAYYMLFLPLLPLTCILFEGVIRPIKYKIGLERDWSTGTGGVFFAKPDGALHRVLWTSHVWLSTQVAQFWVVGTNSRSLAGSYKDEELNKFFFRQLFEQVGAKVAPELARWDGKGTLTMQPCNTKKKKKVFCKASDECLGTGDERLYDYDPATNTAAIAPGGEQIDVKAFMAEKYTSNALIMDFALPTKKLGIHQYDIQTLAKPDGSIQVVSTIFWGDCSDDTSHSTNTGLAIDVATGKYCGVLGHYTAHFAKPGNVNTALIGTDIKQIKEACEKVCAAHKLVNEVYGWVPAIGWDCMLDEDEDLLFFEGNQVWLGDM
jgi:hypothetical protein